MLTIYYVHTVPRMPSQTVSHMLSAAQVRSTDNTSYTHPPQINKHNRYDDSQPTVVVAVVFTSINESKRAIDSDVYKNDSVMNVPL